MKGATFEDPFLFLLKLDFNPRSREGSDGSSRPCDAYCQYFNPRSREGSDYRLGKHTLVVTDFNPRSREGSDPARALYYTDIGYFNPRSREGSDTFLPKGSRNNVLFQSTLP